MIPETPASIFLDCNNVNIDDICACIRELEKEVGYIDYVEGFG